MNCTVHLCSDFFFFPSINEWDLCIHGFRIHRFNQLQIENIIFTTADESTVFYLWVVECPDAKCQMYSRNLNEVLDHMGPFMGQLHIQSHLVGLTLNNTGTKFQPNVKIIICSLNLPHLRSTLFLTESDSSTFHSVLFTFVVSFWYQRTSHKLTPSSDSFRDSL